MAKPINEDMHLEELWFVEAAEQTPATLMEFFNHVMNDYVHDYGTICHAVAACAIAAAWAANRSEGAQGGITGFQAGFVMWDFIRRWEYSHNKTGMRLIDFDNMLYPQYEHRFDKAISRRVWESLQEQAKANLEAKEYAADEVRAHWQSIVDGHVPFGYTVSDADMV